MGSGNWRRKLGAVLVLVLGLVGTAWHTAVAGDVSPCANTTAPFVVSLDAPPVQYKVDGQMEIRATVTNCTTAEWSGNVRVDVTSWQDPGCVPAPLFTPQPASLRVGDTRTLTFRGPQPLCLGNYTATGTVYDTMDRASGSRIFGVGVKPNKPGA